MTMLSERDVKLALELVYDSAEMDDGEPFPRELLLRLTRLIPAPAGRWSSWRSRRKGSHPISRKPEATSWIRIRSGTASAAASTAP